MGLNEHEQRVLDELERGLYAEDEQLARRMQKAAAQAPDRKQQSKAARRIAGILVGIAGLGVILVGAIIHWPWMGAGGFVITLTGLALATGALDKPTDSEQPHKKPKPKKTDPAGSAATAPTAGPTTARRSTKGPRTDWVSSLNDFFEDRWNRRG